ncbi:hypothetical protein ZEAMMB73_Zm00001d006734 [Zea mays]|uniref:Uncharacterized protein n=1 Tax=Zea mays TaxID=4577 RepID=A0A1D6F040_MAIZE|nr:hypothetical protein ZEAMMB73_Zm00001d006734 [Zea mays]
MHGRCYELFDL